MSSSNSPFFSIILSIYNEENEVIEHSINSILNQTYKNFEFILVVDNPKMPISFLKKIKERDTRLKIVVNKKNIGLTRSLIKAIKITKGQYIVRQDADDISLRERLSIAFDFIQKNNSVNFYSTPYIIDNKKRPKYLTRKIITSNSLRYKNYLAHGTLIINSEILKKINYDENFKYSQDFDLYNRLLDEGYVLSYDQKNITYKLGQNPNRISSKYVNEQSFFRDLVIERNGYKFFNTRIARLLRLDVYLDLYNYIFKSPNNLNL